MPHSATEFIRFYNSPFSYWCSKTNKLVDEKKIDAKYKIEINASKLISKQLLIKAQEHEVILKDKYRISENLNVVDMSNKESSNKVFLEELDKSPDVIFQPYISSKDFVGRLDFVQIVENDLHIVDAKLSSSIKKEHIMQLFVYREILEAVTKKQVTECFLFLGDLQMHKVGLDEYWETYAELKNQFLDFNNSYDPEMPPYPKKGGELQEYDDEAKKIWIRDNGLELLHRIQAKQIEKLKNNDIKTVEELKNTKLERIDGMGESTFHKYKKLAKLLNDSTEDEILYEIKDPSLNGLLKPKKGDLYIDFEGYPFLTIGRNFEYLYGIWSNDENNSFTYYWSDDEEAEKTSFTGFMENLLEHIKLYPDAKFYHYFSYEITSLRKSAQTFGMYEKELEELIERKCFEDLFKTVNSSLLIGASSYSLKIVEKLAGISRTEDLQSGMESIQYFEDYFFNQEYELKDSIIDYNKADCKNLYLLHDWLAKLL
jgi:predicted RecB family nuclease